MAFGHKMRVHTHSSALMREKTNRCAHAYLYEGFIKIAHTPVTLATDKNQHEKIL